MNKSCYLYILENKCGKHYVGITTLLPKERLLRHNTGDVLSTKLYRPWKIVYVESLTALFMLEKERRK
jgi:predicted GIY-YIG superfamily endonuclease